MGTHTATGEWQSFELRMRRRRAERLVLRAEVAAEAGFPEDARAFIEEARRLAPGLPELSALQRKLDDTALPVTVARRAPVASTFSRKILAPAAIAASAIVVIVIASRPHPIVPAVDGRAIALPAPSIEFHETAAAVASRETPPANREPVTPTRPTSAAPSAPLPKPSARDIGEIPDDWVTPPTARLVTASTAQVRPPAPVERPDGPAAEPAAPPAPMLDGLASNPPGSSVPVSVSAFPPAPSMDADTAVRRVLDRYAAAYNALDAAAAARVWPRVNRRALARAFDGLASQQVSLGNCRVDVQGASARADCTGATTWAPKVGDQATRTESRRWTFELARSGDNWQIVNARAQNR